MSSTPNITPRGLSRSQAAAYVGVSPSTFDTLIDEGFMPAPKRARARVLWDRHQLDEAFEALPGGGPTTQGDDDTNEWDA